MRSRKPQAASRKPQAASRKPQAASRKPQAASRKPQAASRKPQAASRKPQAASRKPQAATLSSSGNRVLSAAKKAKQDEFYTQLNDISRELKHYKSQLRGKTVFCNCDDPFESNFFKYFALNFNALGLKKLIATGYKPSPIVGGELPLFSMVGLKPREAEPYAIEIKEVPDHNDDGAIDIADVKYLLQHDANASRPLEGDKTYSAGDFRSDECVELLKESDVVVTNPPFSLFREYIAQLVDYDKKFVIIGNTNAITYKEIFKLIRENKFRTGNTMFNVGMFFAVPDDWEKYHHIDEGTGKKIARVSTSCWYTNLDVAKHHEFIPLYKKYAPQEYPKYDNFDAIEVSKVADIPVDYDGLMGVPITFLDKYNPDQFEILGSFNAGEHGAEIGAVKTETITKGKKIMWNGPVVNKQPLYKRIIIKWKK